MSWHRFVSRIMLPGCLLACGAHALYSAEDDAKESPELFAQLDKNGDGILERSELDEDRHKFFDRVVRVADGNDDGKLTASEFAEAIKPKRPAAKESFGASDPNQRRGDMTQMLRRIDRDGNQKISKDELPEPLRERFMPLFERLGKDELTMQEFQAGMTRGPQMQDFTGRLFAQLDRNKNDKIELDEMPERIRDGVKRILERMGKPDAESFTKEEFAQVMRRGNPGGQPRGPQSSPLFRKLDSDRNGSLSKAELAKAPEILAELDTDGDGEVSLRELEGSARGGMRPNDGPRPENQDRFSRLLREADKDGDGKISKEEAPDRTKRVFDRLDADSDGFITREEVRRLFERSPQSN